VAKLIVPPKAVGPFVSNRDSKEFGSKAVENRPIPNSQFTELMLTRASEIRPKSRAAVTPQILSERSSRQKMAIRWGKAYLCM
jgi:hypothetical protein